MCGGSNGAAAIVGAGHVLFSDVQGFCCVVGQACASPIVDALALLGGQVKSLRLGGIAIVGRAECRVSGSCAFHFGLFETISEEPEDVQIVLEGGECVEV